MARFEYKALKNNNQIVNGSVEASSFREARAKIRQLGFVPTKVYTEENLEQHSDSSNEQKTLSAQGLKVKRLSLQEKIMFTSELAVMLSAGIPILEALHSLEINASSKKIKVICNNIQKSIISGKTFAEALSSLYGKVFGQVYIALVKTGEDSGELEVTLERMLVLLRKQDKIKGKIINASIYPAVLIVIMILLLILFSTKIFPAFYGMLQFNGADIPLFSQILIGFCQFVEHFWGLLIIGLGALCGGISFLFQNPLFKTSWDKFILKIPVISDFIQYINLSNFMTVLHISYDAGIPLISGVELSNKTVGNNTIKKRVYNAISLMRSGKPLSDAFNITGVTPSALTPMIATGEKSGTLGKMLHDAAEVIDKKVDMALDTMVKLFEPTVIVIMGIAVGFIALGFYQMYIAALGSLF